ncbi:unnamed protein product [Cylicostephanus goldi]|uniref:inositol-polyphosphate 5-phosphatase n=1 Tax=Cylicostephanus goldi TaxID=71465 RepID=A0A3P6QGR7_CYLGO|nr:unnamed protein product [Cylicostephanus goldi]
MRDESRFLSKLTVKSGLLMLFLSCVAFSYAECAWQVPKLIDELTIRVPMYTTVQAYLDLDHMGPSFTALGNVILIKSSCIGSMSQYNFKTCSYAPVVKGTTIVGWTDELDSSPLIIKKKFPKDFWPTFKWGRKGYMQTRWKLNNIVLDFVNVHLFHDESNLALIHEEKPCSVFQNPFLYSTNRKRALNYVLEQLSSSGTWTSSHCFVFGDFNFRLDSTSFLNVRGFINSFVKVDILSVSWISFLLPIQPTETGRVALICIMFNILFFTFPLLVMRVFGSSLISNVLQRLTERASAHPLEEPHGSVADGLVCENNTTTTETLRRTVSAIEFRRPSLSDIRAGCVLRIEKKRFDYFNQKKLLDDWKSYLEDDREPSKFSQLHELPINFPPTFNHDRCLSNSNYLETLSLCSYPWSEDPDESEVMMKTRAPAWCDRVLMNDSAFELVKKGSPTYSSFGRDVCTGDHKVGLSILVTICNLQVSTSMKYLSACRPSFFAHSVSSARLVFIHD